MLNKQDNRKLLLGLLSLAAGLSVFVPDAGAALLTGTPVASPTIPANLTSLGTTDWAYWNSTSSTGLSSRAPTNTASGVTHIIGSATPINASGVRGSGTASAITFTFTNGTTETTLAVAGVFNASLDKVGNGVQTTVTLPDTQPYKVLVWVSGYNGTGTFTATLPDTTNYQDASFSYEGGTKPARLYELQVQADHANDVLTLSHVLTTDDGDSSHVLIGGVAVSRVPEPASMLIVSGAACLLLARRRA